MKVVVTGGSGFIGGSFIRKLLRETNAEEVANIDKLSYGSNPASLADLSNDKRYRFIRGDINHENVIRPLVAEADFVVNLAAETHVDRSISSGRAFIKSNVMGVSVLLEALRHSKKLTRFIQVGTDEEYGEAMEGSFRENDLLRPSSPYAATKASSSMLVSAYARTYGLNCLVTRCTNNFGPYQFPEKLIPKTIVRAMKNLPVPIYGSGRQVRDWIFVTDHCEALLVVMRSGKAGETYNVSAGNEVDNLSLVRRILRILNKRESLIAHTEDRPGHDFRYSLDSSKLRRELGWAPKRSLEEALTQTVRWYMENKAWWQPIASRQVLSPRPWKEKW